VSGTAGIAVPLALAVAAPAWSRIVLRRFRGWLLEYDAVALTLLGVVVGAKLVYDGLSAL
jgi:hypothetical protein